MPEPFRFALEKYLKEAGHLRPVRLGDAPVLPEPVSPADLDRLGPNGEAQKNEAFARYAEDGAGSRDSILWVCVAMPKHYSWRKAEASRDVGG